jgi:glutathione S-transferase
VSVKLYWFSISHPAQAARLMLDRKEIDYRKVDLVPGIHPLLLRAAGFRGTTVPALRLDGRRIQGSRAISRALDELKPEPFLFPLDRDRRRAVEEAEAWGERALPPIPRRIFRWWLSSDTEARVWMARELLRMPAPALMARTNAPIVRALARKSRAYDDTVRADVEALSAKLDRVDELIAAGTIAAAEPNAADYQIGTSVRTLMLFEDLRPLIEGRRAADLALRTLPDFGRSLPPGILPAKWL